MLIVLWLITSKCVQHFIWNDCTLFISIQIILCMKGIWDSTSWISKFYYHKFQKCHVITSNQLIQRTCCTEFNHSRSRLHLHGHWWMSPVPITISLVYPAVSFKKTLWLETTCENLQSSISRAKVPQLSWLKAPKMSTSRLRPQTFVFQM